MNDMMDNDFCDMPSVVKLLKEERPQKISDPLPLQYIPGREWACVIRLGAIGDDLIATSILPLLAKDYNVEVIAEDPQHVIFENNPYIAKLTVKKRGDLPEGQNNEWQNWFAARSKEYAKFIHLSHSCEDAIAFFPCQTKFWYPDSVRRRLCSGVSYLEYVHDIAEVPHVFRPQFFPTEAERTKAQETKAKVGRRVIGWAISGSRFDKMYPQSPMVIGRLIKELDVPVILFGGPGKDNVIAKQIMEHVERQNGTTQGLHLALTPDVPAGTQAWEMGTGTHVEIKDAPPPLWPIRRSLAQILTMDLMIGPDTGLMWAAGMEPFGKIMLLSHASPTNITKHWINTVTLHADQKRVPCFPCHRLHNTIDTCKPNKENNGAACITDINPEDIVQAARKLLDV